jgi:hypothetical protein
LAAPTAELLQKTGSAAAFSNLILLLKGFEDKVERAEQLRRSRLSCESISQKEGLI